MFMFSAVNSNEWLFRETNLDGVHESPCSMSGSMGLFCPCSLYLFDRVGESVKWNQHECDMEYSVDWIE